MVVQNLISSEEQPIASPVSFADVAHQTLIFDPQDEAARLILKLIDTPWVQRLRRIRQTGNSSLVYMYAEHSRFGHSLGVAYLANRVMKTLAKSAPALVSQYRLGVAAAALLHDIGHVAPGSHLAERVWSPEGQAAHEDITARIVCEDRTISELLESHQRGLAETVRRILLEDTGLPPWTRQIISGGGWNADRGNWTIVDSAMASVSYGRYNVFALIDSFRLSPNGELVLQENRLDALTHFFVARHSMYRQVYQHRVLQAADRMTEILVRRLSDLIDSTHRGENPLAVADFLRSEGIFFDAVMLQVLVSRRYGEELELSQIFSMTESWWQYHLEQWCNAGDPILSDLAQRLRDRRLFKTVRSDRRLAKPVTGVNYEPDRELIEQAQVIANELGYDPRYYVLSVEQADKHRKRSEDVPLVLLDSGEVLPVTEVEPLIDEILKSPSTPKSWLAVPAEVKVRLRRAR